MIKGLLSFSRGPCNHSLFALNVRLCVVQDGVRSGSEEFPRGLAEAAGLGVKGTVWKSHFVVFRLWQQLLHHTGPFSLKVNVSDKKKISDLLMSGLCLQFAVGQSVE